MKLFVGYSKAPEQPQSSARPICQSHAMTSTGREPALLHIGARRTTHYATGEGRLGKWMNSWKVSMEFILTLDIVTHTCHDILPCECPLVTCVGTWMTLWKVIIVSCHSQCCSNISGHSTGLVGATIFVDHDQVSFVFKVSCRSSVM